MNPIARRANIFCENLPTEVVLYNKQTQEVHCLNKTVAIVWENADGTRSVDQLSRVLEQRLSVSSGRDLVLGALAELSVSGLLENVQQESKEETVSRRGIARKLAMAGMSGAILPIAYLVAPPSKAAACTQNLTKAEADESAVSGLLGGQPGVTLTGDKLTANCTYTGSNSSLTNACTEYDAGIASEKTYNNESSGSKNSIYLTQAETEFATAASDLNGFVPNVP